MLMKMHGKSKLLPILMLCGLVLAACGGESGDGSDTGQGTLSMSLVDSSTEEYQAVYVTIARIEVHHDTDGSWETVAEPGETFNLLELVGGVRAPLGVTSLDPGHYTQMRLIIGETADAGLNLFSEPHPFANYVIDGEDVIHTLKVPSGTNTGLKIVNGFDIGAGQNTDILLDFDAKRSVVKAGKSGQYLLKPTVKVLPGSASAVVIGSVTGSPSMLVRSMEAVSGAFITAQRVNVQAGDAKDQVVIDGGTLTDASGSYSLSLTAGTYNLVATRDHWNPVCKSVSTSTEGPIQIDFQLEIAETGMVFGVVTIDDPPGEGDATIEFRQAIDCGTGLTMVTVKLLNVADGSDYMAELPVGDYQLVASTSNRKTIVIDKLTVTSWGQIPEDISFTQ